MDYRSYVLFDDKSHSGEMETLREQDRKSIKGLLKV